MNVGRLAVAVLILTALSTACVQAAQPKDYSEMIRTDVLVIGSTPCGIASAIAAARQGEKVIVADMNDFMGGMMTNGLGKTDIGPRHTIKGIFKEFIDLVYADYLEKYGPNSEQVRQSSTGYYFEPNVAERIFNRMVKAEKNITLKYHYRPDGVWMNRDKLDAVYFRDTRNNRRIQIRAAVFIDATYEGDIAAMCGATYRVGRESREEFGEPFAGVLYMDHYTRMILPGSTGRPDKRVQAYNFRLTLTANPENRVMPKKPAGYNREEYLQVLESIEKGRIRTVQDVLNIEFIANGKSDTNNMPRSLISTDLPEENYTYPEAGYAEREKIVQRHKDYILGLLWFLQNDPEMPEALRAECAQYGFAKDEYPTTSDHFPRQLYVREARRIWCDYNFTAHDAMLGPGLQRTPIHWNSIACGGYAMDSHATQKREPGKEHMEGFYWMGGMTQPYQIPYGVMVPQTVNGLLVPGPASATHIGFGTLRMEPVWMALGQAAGNAAHIARQLYLEPRDVPINRVQALLLDQGAIITTFNEMKVVNPGVTANQWKALQFWGTRGFFNSYDALPAKPITRGEAASWLMSGFRLGDFMAAWGPFMKHNGGGSGAASLAQLQGMYLLPEAGDPDAELTASELRFWLAKIEPWIDGSFGDKWTERVRAKESLPTAPESTDPDPFVTRAQFCEALYEKYRYATPGPIQ